MASDANNPNFPEIRPLISTDADPEAEPALTQARARASSHGVGSRRRKVPDSVTPNACTNCKRARAKVIHFLFDVMHHLTLCDERAE